MANLWNPPTENDLAGLVIPKRIRLTKKALERARRKLAKRLAPYQTRVTVKDLLQELP